MTPTSANAEPPPSTWTLLRPYVFDIAGPFIGYAVAHLLGSSGLWAMTAAGAISALSAGISSIRRKGLDAVGALVFAEILVAIAIMILVREERLLLIRPSIYTAVASVFLLVSAFSGKPLSYAGARTMAARGGAARIAAYERTWQTSADFRRTHFWVTLGFGVALAVDSLLRVVIVYQAPIRRSEWLSNVPHLAAMVLMISTSALAGRRFSRLVDEQIAAEKRKLS
jgi:hypothetical protein